MLHTTFRRAKEANACQSSYRKMARALGGITKYGWDIPIPLDKVLEVCGFEDALWSLRIILEPADKEIRLLLCDYAESVLYLYEQSYPDDKRLRQVILVARQFALGRATEQELTAAKVAAWTVIGTLTAAGWAIKAVAWTVIRTTVDAPRLAAGTTTLPVERQKQILLFKKMLDGIKGG